MGINDVADHDVMEEASAGHGASAGRCWTMFGCLALLVVTPLAGCVIFAGLGVILGH